MAWQAFQSYRPYPPTPLLDSSSCTRKLYRAASYSSSSSHYPALDHLSKHRESVSSSSGSSVCEPVSPMGRRLSAISTDIMTLDSDGEAVSSEEPWNLVAYHIPWGPGYEGYETGTLPGPDGTCVFLRSPTPLKRQRTSQACDKCRERKAKCSGDRPSCTRCLSRGIPCVYGLSTQTHSRKKGHVVDNETSPEDGGVQASVSEFKDTIYCTADCNELPANLDDHLSPYSRLSLLGDDFESPVEAHIPPFVSSPEANTSCKLSDHNSTSLYVHPLSALDAYRFPPEGEQTVIPTPQPPPSIPSFPINSHISSSIENSGNSLLISNVPLSSELDGLWDDTGFFEGSGTFPGDLLPESFRNNTLPCTRDSGGYELGDNNTLRAHFQSLAHRGWAVDKGIFQQTDEQGFCESLEYI